MRDCEGHARWRVRVGPGEMTCLACGETFGAKELCPRCGFGEDGQLRGNPPPSVETLSYLREGEWERV